MRVDTHWLNSFIIELSLPSTKIIWGVGHLRFAEFHIR